MTNPLQKYFRQPKLYIPLPSKGLFYEPGVLTGDATNVPIFGMTGMDEVIMKTPDALFSGEATAKLIQSCCPFITDGHRVPSLDIDALLVAIRIATFGENMTVSANCKNCGEENEFEINLNGSLDHYSNLPFDNKVQIADLSVSLKPLTYEEMSKFNIENFKLQKMLNQLEDEQLPEEERQQHFDAIYEKLADIQAQVFLASIESITTPDAVVTEKQYIGEWLANTVSENYKTIKDRLEKNKEAWGLPKHHVKCSECGHEDKIEVVLDQSSFFG